MIFRRQGFPWATGQGEVNTPGNQGVIRGVVKGGYNPPSRASRSWRQPRTATGSGPCDPAVASPQGQGFPQHRGMTQHHIEC